MDYRIAVIGAGPGGYVAALRAARMGAGVCIIEKEEAGGTCLNRGCIPTKALLHSAGFKSSFEEAEEHGFSFEGELSLDFTQLMRRKDRVVRRLRRGVESLLKGSGVDYIKGRASLLSTKELEIRATDGVEHVTAEEIIIATGSSPLVPPLFAGSEQICSSREALFWKQLPKSLVIIGGGVVGCELASIFAGLGVEVEIIELLPRILNTFSPEISDLIETALKRKGITIRTDTEVTGVEDRAGGVRLDLGEEQCEADQVLVSVGRRPNTFGIGLEYVGLECDDHGNIPVNSRMETSVPGLWAVGDVTNTPFDLAHAAFREGTVAVENMLGECSSEIDHDLIPTCVYTSPEIASVGLSAEQARAQNREVITGRFDFASSGKAMAIGSTEGFVNVVADAVDHSLLGVEIAGPHATDLISEACVVLSSGGTVDQLADTVHAHPTLSEAVWEAAEDALGNAVHRPH